MRISSPGEPDDGYRREDEPLFEFIDGQRIEIPEIGALACLLANRLAREVNSHAQQLQLGETVVQMLFHLPLPGDRNRRPPFAYVSYDRWPKERRLSPEENAWDVVPNLVAETVSCSDLLDGVFEKIDEYFRAGVQLVWVIHPNDKRIDVFESLKSLQILTEADVLNGGIVLPQFSLPLKILFNY
jgi:Uma2 family endonuclease